MVAAVTTPGQVAALVAEGLSSREIAERLGCSVSTVKRYRALAPAAPMPRPRGGVTARMVSDLIEATDGAGETVALPTRQVRRCLDVLERALDYEHVAEAQSATVRQVIQATADSTMSVNRRLWRVLRAHGLEAEGIKAASEGTGDDD